MDQPTKITDLDLKEGEFVSDNDFELTEYDIQCLLKSEDDIRNGRTRDAKEVVREFRLKYGF